MRTLLDRKNISSRTNSQVAARRVTGLIIKMLCLNSIDKTVGMVNMLMSFMPLEGLAVRLKKTVEKNYAT